MSPKSPTLNTQIKLLHLTNQQKENYQKPLKTNITVCLPITTSQQLPIITNQASQIISQMEATRTLQ